MAEREKKTPEQKLKELEQKIEQMQKQKKAIIDKEKKEKRAARTRRLIQIGALSEKYFVCADIEPDTYEKMIAEIVKIPQVKTILSKPETGGENE